MPTAVLTPFPASAPSALLDQGTKCRTEATEPHSASAWLWLAGLGQSWFQEDRIIEPSFPQHLQRGGREAAVSDSWVVWAGQWEVSLLWKAQSHSPRKELPCGAHQCKRCTCGKARKHRQRIFFGCRLKSGSFPF